MSELVDRVAALEAALRALENRLAGIRPAAPCGPDSAEAAELVTATARVAGIGNDFTVDELLRAAGRDEGLRLAVVAAIGAAVPSGRRVGRLLRRLTGHAIQGLVVASIGTCRDGRIWMIRPAATDLFGNPR